MLFHDSKDESAWGLALVGLLIVSMAAMLGEVTGNVQPKAPTENDHREASAPYLQEHVTPPGTNHEPSPYPQPSHR